MLLVPWEGLRSHEEVSMAQPQVPLQFFCSTFPYLHRRSRIERMNATGQFCCCYGGGGRGRTLWSRSG